MPGCQDFEEFLARMRAEGYEVKWRGKSLEFRAAGQERFTRSYRLGDEYTEATLRERIAGISPEIPEKAGCQDGRKSEVGDKKRQNGSTKRQNGSWKRQDGGKNISLLVDIQAKMQTGKGKGYEQWAKLFNLKEAAKTLNFLTDHGVDDYEGLAARADAAGKRFDSLSARVKQLEGRMAQTAQLKMHTINYAKTRDVYAQYKRSGCNREYRTKHLEEIQKCEAAKAAFDALGGRRIPKVKELSDKYAALLAEKKECYEEYKAARKEMTDYQTAKQNVERIMGLELSENKRQHVRQ